MILSLCDRFRKLPSEIYAEGAELLKMIKIVDMGTPQAPEGGDLDEW